MKTEAAIYRRTVAELQEIARQAPYVTQDWILTVASMDPSEMRRRLIRSYDWHEHFAHSLDGIEAIRNMPGSAPDGCWSHKEVRSVVQSLQAKIERLERSKAPAPEAPLPSIGRELHSMLIRLDDYLRGIRSEELDGSEPTLGALLAESQSLLDRVPPDTVGDCMAEVPQQTGQRPRAT